MIQKKLNENEAKILNVLFKKGKCDLFEIQSLTGINGKELTIEIKNLKYKKLLEEKSGVYSSDFFQVIEKLLDEKERILANA